MIKTDEYGEVINHLDTYMTIADDLHDHHAVLIGWTDEEGSHFDILFTYKDILRTGTIQGGIQSTDLFVSVMRVGAFGFEFNGSYKYWDYISEKLTGGFGPTTGEKLAELINGVMHAIDPTQPGEKNGA